MSASSSARESSSNKKEPSPPAPTTSSEAPSPLIFISHDSRDAELAEAFSRLLSSVSAGILKSFRSTDQKGSQGIEYGVEWYPELMSSLESASDVVCLLTQRSLDRPWMLYEAGVAKGKLDTPVYGIALGIQLRRANTGPFAQFQNCDDKEESLTKLVMQLLDRIPGSEPDHDAVHLQVQTFKRQVAEALENLGKGQEAAEEGPSGDDTSVAKLFEEIKVMFRDLPFRLEGRLTEEMDPNRRKRERPVHPMVVRELAQGISRGPGDLVGILVAASFLRDDFPWLYELGREVYQTAGNGDAEATLGAIQKLLRAGDMISHGRFQEEFASSPEMYRLVQETILFIEELANEYLASPGSPPRRKRRGSGPK